MNAIHTTTTIILLSLVLSSRPGSEGHVVSKRQHHFDGVLPSLRQSLTVIKGEDQVTTSPGIHPTTTAPTKVPSTSQTIFTVATFTVQLIDTSPTEPNPTGPTIAAIPEDRTCGREADEMKNLQNREEFCTLQLQRATKTLLEAVKREEAAEKELMTRDEIWEARKKLVWNLQRSIRAKEAAIRRPGGNTIQMRRMLSDLRNRLRRAISQRNAAERNVENARKALERAKREVSDERGETNSLNSTLRSVREALRVSTSKYLSCKEKNGLQ